MQIWFTEINQNKNNLKMPKNNFKNGTKVLEIVNLLELAEKTGNEAIFQAKHKVWAKKSAQIACFITKKQ